MEFDPFLNTFSSIGLFIGDFTPQTAFFFGETHSYNQRTEEKVKIIIIIKFNILYVHRQSCTDHKISDLESLGSHLDLYLSQVRLLF